MLAAVQEMHPVAGGRQAAGGPGLVWRRQLAALLGPAMSKLPVQVFTLVTGALCAFPVHAEELPTMEEARALQAVEQEELGHNPKGGMAAKVLVSALACRAWCCCCARMMHAKQCS